MQQPSLLTKEYRTVSYVSGPLIFVKNVKGATFGEIAKIILPNGDERTGQVLD
ncbi:V-type ATP synthase subunit B, partial [bacterium]